MDCIAGRLDEAEERFGVDEQRPTKPAMVNREPAS
jgi:hypothetical protein